MGVFPKDYPYNTNAALHDVYEVVDGTGTSIGRTTPRSAISRPRSAACRDLGIEADMIMFHPYDRWGYCSMSPEQDNRYVAYIAARFGAYRNLWWSLANEYDFLLDTKPMEHWDRFFEILEEEDPYRHLKSIHNGHVATNYNHRLPWVTHVCIQHWDVKQTPLWLADYDKPIVNDEPEYEGRLYQSWGNISARELTHRFWTTMMRGGYAGHGETYHDYDNPGDEEIWWAKGGRLHGEAWKRLKWMRALLEEDVKHGLIMIGGYRTFPFGRISAAQDGTDGTKYIYFGEHQPASGPPVCPMTGATMTWILSTPGT